MSTTPLFGQYYNNSAQSTYQNSNYKCSMQTSENENMVVFGNKTLELRDSNDNLISSVNLENINVSGISEWASNSVVVNPGESILLPGLEYGKSYETICFRIPDNIIQYNGFENYLNAEFDIFFSTNFKLRSYHIRISLDNNNISDICSRINQVISGASISPTINVSLKTLSISHYIVFSSTLEGYEFNIKNFIVYPVWQTSEFPDSPFLTCYDFEDASSSILLSSGIKDSITWAENNTKGESTYTILTGNSATGYYGHENPVDKDASIYYQTSDSSVNSSIIEPADSSDSSVLGITPDSTPDSSSLDEIDNYFNHFKDTSLLDSSVSSLLAVYGDKCTYGYRITDDDALRINPYRYPNGAGQIWMIIPDYPSDISTDNAYIKINHVSSQIPLFYDSGNVGSSTGEILYKRQDVKVIATEKDEIEKYNIDSLKLPVFTLSDTSTDITPEVLESISRIWQSSYTVNYDSSISDNDTNETEIYKIGMYKYLQEIDSAGLWTNVSQEYSLITAKDDPNSNSKNLANSIFIYNPQVYPVKVIYFTAD